ncbi:MAG: cyclic lactone autoinducer peptide [Clostridia bacterium]|nr:cyclic lactone autoinducer peptide [Clostridia bacterium]
MSKSNFIWKKLSTGALSSMAALALMVTATNVSTCCWYVFGQDELPKNAKKLRKF